MVSLRAVRLSLGVLVGFSAAGPATAMDWRAAGGGLFAHAPPPPEPAAPSRLQPLSQPYAEAIAAAAAAHGLDPKLLHALVLVESAYRPRATSPAGAAGLTQLMPATARSLGVEDRFDPGANLDAGADYLAALLLRFHDLRLALAAFNTGPARVARFGAAPADVAPYVDTVVSCYLALAAGRRLRTSWDCRAPGPAPTQASRFSTAAREEPPP